ncbi:hypothetical protein D3C83_58410 [compost metagenome]
MRSRSRKLEAITLTTSSAASPLDKPPLACSISGTQIRSALSWAKVWRSTDERRRTSVNANTRVSTR